MLCFRMSCGGCCCSSLQMWCSGMRRSTISLALQWAIKTHCIFFYRTAVRFFDWMCVSGYFRLRRAVQLCRSVGMAAI
jgi:hypothetical protein